MSLRWERPFDGRRDLRIDWLRGLAMTCVIVDHSRLWSLLSWFTYERFWIVTAAEVFVILSGVVLGTVYGGKLVRHGWPAVLRGLGRRALTLYAAFVGVTLSLFLISAAGIDARSLTSLAPVTLNAAAWRDLAFMRFGPWPFQIVGLYVWLVAAAAPCLYVLRRFGWRPLLALSWGLYLWYRISPRALTTAEFETVFPILAWQLLFVHGIVIGSHREQLRAFVERVPRRLSIAIAGTAAAAFLVLALCNPWADGPGFLRWNLVSEDRFTALYFTFFPLTELGIGRILNLAVGLPVGYALLTWCWRLARPFCAVFVTLGQQSLAAFVLQVYVVLLVEQLPIFHVNDFWINTLAQIGLVVAMVGLLQGARHLRVLMASGAWRGFVPPARARAFGLPTPTVPVPQPAEPVPALPGHS